MRVPVSWLREYAPIPEPYDALEVGRRLTQAGLEVEAVEQVGHDVHGVITAQVITVEELTGFKQPIRYCRVAVSDAELAVTDPETLTGVICGAVNFAPGDRVAFATVGATLPGGFEITAAKKYGRVSEGMICAVDELGIGEDHSGILVLPPDTPLGVDFVELRGAARRRARDHRHPGPRLRRVDQGRGARARQRVPGPVHRPGADVRARRGRVGTWTAAERPTGDAAVAGRDRRPDRVRPLRAARGPRLRPEGAHAAVDAGPARPLRACAASRSPST